MSILLDAGPSLNFLAVGQENILIQLAASRGLRLAAPTKVDAEVFGMCKDPRFAATAAQRTWDKLKAAERVTILSDALTQDTFAAAVSRISGMPAHQRVRTSKNLGEIMVTAHASVLAQAGQNVYILMDDRDGRQMVKREDAWLATSGATGAIDLWSTPRVLKQASAEPGWIKNGLTWEQVYRQMRPFDDGLPPLPK